MNPGKTMDAMELAPPVPLDMKRPLRFGLGALAIGAAVTLWWSAAVPLAEGVPADGVVKTEGSRRSLQHARGGTLREILVRDGDTVRQGQPLLRLDDTDAKARMGMIEARWWPSLAQEARLLAERDGLARITFPSELVDAKTPGAADAMGAQHRLFDARRAALSQDDVAQQAAVDSLRAYGSGLKDQSGTREEQIR